MHAKRRHNRLMLYRTRWVAKDMTAGIAHGYSAQEYVASLSVDATDMPPDVEVKLTSVERAWLVKTHLEPARRAAAQRCRLEEERQADPRWRVAEAVRLLREAAPLSRQRPVTAGELAAVGEVVEAFAQVGGVRKPKAEPLEVLNAALAGATRAIVDGTYGRAPENGVRESKVYRAWQEFQRLLNDEDGYLRALQARGWVKARGR